MFLRSDELPGDAAIGYLYETGLRSNVFHLPVLGNGGIYTTLDDVDAFWSALFGGRIVSAETVAEMIRPRSDDESGTRRYGLGFWLRLERTVFLEGAGAGWPVRVGAGCCAGAVARSSSGDRARSRRCDMFVWVLEAKATDPGEVGRQLGRWTNEFGDTPGYLGATGGVTDDSRFLLFVRWESEEAGNELLMRPAHLAWYDEFQRSFDGAVEFAETADVTTHLAGGSDAAGFVQAMKVSGVDRQRVEAADREFETMAPHVRPDLIGGIRSWTSPDGFVAANYFTSEDDARAGERKDPPPELAERFEDFMAMMKDAEYFDFTEPFVHSAPGS